VSSPKPDSHVKYTFDQLGAYSVRELVDSSGVVRADYRYSTYGERTKVGGDLDSDFGFGGLFHHGPSGLDLATYRIYDSKMGRWISREPLGEGVDYNLYRYANNSPISFRDPSGLLPDDTPAYTGPVNQQTEAPWVANRPGPLDALLVAGAAEVGIATVGAVATYGVLPGLGLAGAQVGESAMALGMAAVGAFPRGPLYGPAGRQARGGFARGRDHRRGKSKPCPPRTPSTLQTGGHTLEKSTVNALNKTFGTKMSGGEWGGRFEDLKSANSLPPDFHETRIMSNGDVFNRVTGGFMGNLGNH
jgi:RHS repeat-associated protein